MKNDRETCAIGSGTSIERHADRAYFKKVRRSARGGYPWARRARRCEAATKSEVMVEISRLLELAKTEALKAKTWIPGGVVADQALPLALRHLSH